MAFALAGCASAPSGAARALAPRPAEAIDPRAPVISATTPQPADPALAARLAELTGRAHQAETAFAAAAAQAERLTAAAGPPQSESWVVAQQALSAVVAAREPAARALGDIDALAQTQLTEHGGIAPADLAAIEAAAADVGALDRRQAERIDALQARLGG
ncbi:MAG: hypothetical protein ABI626_04695 [Sphingomicrobium sp.]